MKKSFSVSVNEKITIYYNIYNLFSKNSPKGSAARMKILSLGKSSSVSGKALRYVTQFLIENSNPIYEKILNIYEHRLKYIKIWENISTIY